MDEQIKPVAWYAELDAPSFRDHGHKYGPEWPSSRDRLPAEQTVELDGGLMTIKHQPLYDQQAIDTLRAEVAEAWAAADSKAGWEWKKRAERAEAEARRWRFCIERDVMPVVASDGKTWCMFVSVTSRRRSLFTGKSPAEAVDAAIDAAKQGAE